MALILNIDSVDQIDYLQGRSLRTRQASSGTSSLDLTLIDPVVLPAVDDVVEILDGMTVLWSGVATVVKVDDFYTKALFVSVTASNDDVASIDPAPFGLSDDPDGATTFGYSDLSTTESSESDGIHTTATLQTRTAGLLAGMVVAVTNALHGWAAEEFSINELTTEYQIEGQILYRLALGDPKVKLSAWLATAAEDAVLPITETKIADGAISTPKLQANAVTTNELAAGAVTTAKLDADAVIANVINVGATVTIDDDGILITDGVLTLRDIFGDNVLEGAGFGTSWLDFIAGGFYNGHFGVGSTSSIVAVTEVSGGDTAADYLASLSADLPYWVVSIETGAGTLKRIADSNAIGGFALQWAGTEDAEIYQDIPVIPGQQYEIFTSWRYTNSTSEFATEFTLGFRDSDHALIGSEQASGYTINTSQATYVNQEHDRSPTAPTNARYLRVALRVTRNSGSPTVWVNSFTAQPVFHLGPFSIYGGTLGVFELPSSTNARVQIGADGHLAIGSGSAAGDIHLYRSGTKELTIDSNGVGTVSVTKIIARAVELAVDEGFFRSFRSGAGLSSFIGSVTGDTGPRTWLGTSGVLQMDDGSHAAGSGNVDLRQLGAGILAFTDHGANATVELVTSSISSAVERGSIKDDTQTLSIGRYVTGDGGARVISISTGANTTNALLAFYGTTPIVKPTVTGSRGGNAALASLLTQLANLGLLTDSSS